MPNFSAVERAEYYDRNPIDVNGDYSATAVVTTALTQRFIYTVPANRKAFCLSGYAHVLRSTAAGANGTDDAKIAFGTLINNQIIIQATVWALAQGTFAVQNVGFFGPLLTGDVIRGGTIAGSTTPSNDYEIHFRGIEFDA